MARPVRIPPKKRPNRRSLDYKNRALKTQYDKRFAEVLREYIDEINKEHNFFGEDIVTSLLDELEYRLDNSEESIDANVIQIGRIDKDFDVILLYGEELGSQYISVESSGRLPENITEKEFIKLRDPALDILTSNNKKQEKEVPTKIAVKLLPSVRDDFKSEAGTLHMPFSEYVRRALFAAKVDPAALISEEVEALEAEYQEGLGVSRWSKPSRT